MARIASSLVLGSNLIGAISPDDLAFEVEVVAYVNEQNFGLMHSVKEKAVKHVEVNVMR